MEIGDDFMEILFILVKSFFFRYLDFNMIRFKIFFRGVVSFIYLLEYLDFFY